MKQPNQHSLLTHVPIAMVSPQGGASCGANTSALLFSKVVCTLAAVQCFSSPAPTELWGRCCEACNHHPLTALHSSSLWANSTWGIRGHLTCRPPKPALPTKPASFQGILAMSAQRTTHNMSTTPVAITASHRRAVLALASMGKNWAMGHWSGICAGRSSSIPTSRPAASICKSRMRPRSSGSSLDDTSVHTGCWR